MKGKIFLIIIFSVLLFVAIAQIFSIPPYHKEIFPVYKSGYFNELEKSSHIVKDAYLTIMATGDKRSRYVYLRKVEKQTGIIPLLYNRRGKLVFGEKKHNEYDPKQIISFIGGAKNEKGEILNSRYSHMLQVRTENECLICHRNRKKNDIMGAFHFIHPVNGFIYYSSERVILFTVLSIVLALLLFYVIRWDPEKNIKELFDK